MFEIFETKATRKTKMERLNKITEQAGEIRKLIDTSKSMSDADKKKFYFMHIALLGHINILRYNLKYYTLSEIISEDFNNIVDGIRNFFTRKRAKPLAQDEKSEE